MIPQIAPITAPNIISVKSDRLKANEPAKIENTIKANSVYIKPIKSPLTSPNSLTFLSPKKTPKNMLAPLITWFIGAMALSGMFVNLRRKANTSISTSETHSAISVPFITPPKNGFSICFIFCDFAFIFIFDSFKTKYTFAFYDLNYVLKE